MKKRQSCIDAEAAADTYLLTYLHRESLSSSSDAFAGWLDGCMQKQQLLMGSSSLVVNNMLCDHNKWEERSIGWELGEGKKGSHQEAGVRREGGLSGGERGGESETSGE